MNTTTPVEITLKINSYQSKNIVLKNNDVLFENNKIQNFVSEKLTECSDELLDAILDDFNTHIFNLSVYGNKFEQELVKLCFKSRGLPDTAKLEAFESIMSLSTEKRLAYIKSFADKNWFTIEKQNIYLNILSDDYDINLPDYPLVNINLSPNAPQIVVAKDLQSLKKLLRDGVSEPVAFCFGVDSQMFKHKYIIGISDENASEIIQAYIESQYINPIVTDIIEKYQLLDVNRVFLALNCTDTTFYFDGTKTNLTAFTNDNIITGIHSLFIDDNCNLFRDRELDLKKLFIRTETTQNTDGFNSTNYLKVYSEKGLLLKGLRETELETSFFFETNEPIAKLFLSIKDHCYATDIKVNIDHGRWRVGKSYRVNVEVFPSDAEDKLDIALSSSNTEVAEVYGNEVYIKGDGSFDLIATGKEKTVAKRFDIDTYKINSISTRYWPDQNIITSNDAFSTAVLINDVPVSPGEFRFEVLSADKIVEVKKGNKGITVFCRKKGKAQIKIISVEDETKYCIKNLIVKKDPKAKNDWFFLIGGMGLLIASAILMFMRSSLTFPGLVLSLAMFVVAAIRKEKLSLIILPVAVVLLSVIGVFRCGVYYDVSVALKLSELSDSMIQEMSDNTKLLVNEAPFESYYDDVWETNTYLPYSTEYIGVYFDSKDRLVLKDKNEVYFIYKVEASCPNDNSSIVRYAYAKYKNVEITAKGEVIYETDHCSLEYFDSFDSLKKEIGKDIETNIDNDVAFSLLGYNKYIYSAEQISVSELQEEINLLIGDADISSTESASGVTYGNVDLYKVILLAPEDKTEAVYWEHQNKVLVVLAQDMFENGQKIGSYYHIVEYTDIAFNEEGNLDFHSKKPKTAYTTDLEEYLSEYIENDIFNSKYKILYIE